MYTFRLPAPSYKNCDEHQERASKHNNPKTKMGMAIPKNRHIFIHPFLDLQHSHILVSVLKSQCGDDKCLQYHKHYYTNNANNFTGGYLDSTMDAQLQLCIINRSQINMEIASDDHVDVSNNDH